MVYSFEQDALGRQTAVKVGNQTLSQSQYQNDPTKPNFGTLTATTYGNGAKVSSRYDDFNRVTGVVYGEETAPRYEYDYNAQGKVARVRDNLLNRTTQSEYDLANRPVRVKTSEDAKHVYTGQVAYDNVYGNLSEFTEKVGENRQEFGTKFGYDDENRPTSLTYSASGKEIGQSTTTIDKLNRTTFSAVKLGSKTFTSEYHFAAGGYGTGSVTNLVSSITQPGCNCGYGYDDNGNIASATLNGKWTGYTYDALGQLTQVNDHSDTRSGADGTTWKYTYDLGGNILKKERFVYNDTTTPLETVTYEYGDANWRDKLTAVNGNAIRYDAIGNPLSDGTWTYTWQNGRQLQKMQKAGVTAEFVYNADGLRVQKTVNGVATKYTLHGKNVVHMTSGTDELHFFYDAQNRPAVVVYNGVPYAYVKSLQGDVIALLDGTGNVVVSYVYDAWGAPIGKSGSMAETLGTVQPFRYRGYVFDEETGLYYLRSRYYNPQIERFVTPDNTFFLTCDIANPIATNLFGYCNNNPSTSSDNDGTVPYCAAIPLTYELLSSVVSFFLSINPFVWIIVAATVATTLAILFAASHIKASSKAHMANLQLLAMYSCAALPPPPEDPKNKGTKTNGSVTKYTDKRGRIQLHVENMSSDAHNVHVHVDGEKYYYDVANRIFYDTHKNPAPRSVQELLNNDKFVQKLVESLQILGY